MDTARRSFLVFEHLNRIDSIKDGFVWCTTEVKIDIGDDIAEDIDGLGEFHMEAVVLHLTEDGDDMGFDSCILFGVVLFLFKIHGGLIVEKYLC